MYNETEAPLFFSTLVCFATLESFVSVSLRQPSKGEVFTYIKFLLVGQGARSPSLVLFGSASPVWVWF